jgi:hypothetical protein
MTANRLTGTQLTDEQKRRQRGKNIAVMSRSAGSAARTSP